MTLSERPSAKPYYYRFELKGIPPQHKRTPKQTAEWKVRVIDAVEMHKPRSPLNKARLTLIRHGSREPDFDNLVSSFKCVIDALVKAGLLIDDSYSVIGQSEYIWCRATREDSKIEVIIEGL